VKTVTITNRMARPRRAARSSASCRDPSCGSDAPVAGNVPQPVMVQGWAIDGAGPGTGVDTVRVYATTSGGTPIFLRVARMACRV
jgi:hypothetical protein